MEYIQLHPTPYLVSYPLVIYTSIWSKDNNRHPTRKYPSRIPSRVSVSKEEGGGYTQDTSQIDRVFASDMPHLLPTPERKVGARTIREREIGFLQGGGYHVEIMYTRWRLSASFACFSAERLRFARLPPRRISFGFLERVIAAVVCIIPSTVQDIPGTS